MKILAVTAIVGAALAAAATAAAPTLTLAASAPTVVYGKPVTLSGVLSSQKTNQQITLQEQACGKTTFTKAANVKTTTGGKFSFAAQTPTANTGYQAKWKSLTSSKVTVSVKPLLVLTKVAKGSYSAKLTAGMDFKGKVILFQRYSRLKKRWKQVKKVILTTSTAGPSKPTMVSSASFKSKLPRRTRVRVAISKAQAGACYLPTASKSLRA